MEIIVLTTPGCGNCKKVEAMLEQLGVEYRVVDITRDPEMAQRFQLMTAPGVVIDGKLAFSGVPSIEELKKAVGL